MCEHTAEYALIPNLIAILSQRFQKIVPIYFWTRREGSSMARLSAAGTKVRIIAVFARRPKVLTPNDDEIFVKFNQHLFEITSNAAKVSIPVLAGVPLVTSLMDFGLHTNCAWFHLKETALKEDTLLRLSLDCNIITGKTSDQSITGPLREEQILECICHQTQQSSWDDAIQRIRIVRSDSEDLGAFYGLFGSGYKPFYMLLLDS